MPEHPVEPGLVTGAVQIGDTANFSEAYSTATAGTGNKTLVSSGTVSDGNSGLNYTYTFVNFATGTINQATLTVTGLTANNKVYDRTTNATTSGTATLSGLIGSDTATLGGSPVATFASAGVGTGIAVTVTGYTISGGQSANYTLTQPVTGLSANITAAPLTVAGLTANNKVYDRTTNATTSGTAALSGLIAPDTATLGGSAVATFASPGVGNGIAVTVTGYSISGGQSANYTLTQPATGLSANITSATLTVTGLTANNKSYDGTTNATTSGTAALSGLIAPDTATLGGSPMATFASAGVGNGIAVTVTGYSISGGQSANYTLTQPVTGLSANITAATLTVTGLTANNKVYDRTTNATISGTAALSGLIGSDTATLGGSPVATFASAGVGTGIVVTVTGYTISGGQSANYTLTQPIAGLSANITAAPLTVIGLTANNKVYDRTTSATTSGTAALSGLIGPDTATLGGSPVPTFASAGVGNGIAVTVTGYSISGGQSANYSLAQPIIGLSANITQAALTVTGLTANNKAYDGTTNASTSGTAALSGLIGPDTATLGGSPVATFASAGVGTGIAVTVTGYTISGGQSANYTLTQPVTGLSANITARSLTVTGITANNKPYDGATSATLSGTPALSGFAGGDTATLGGAPSATFASAGAGTRRRSDSDRLHDQRRPIGQLHADAADGSVRQHYAFAGDAIGDGER